jgi:hypothetical protein
MKAMYLIPSTEVMQVEAYDLLQAVSGVGFNDGGQTTGDDISPQ